MCKHISMEKAILDLPLEERKIQEEDKRKLREI
jgi:hypothetical protein